MAARKRRRRVADFCEGDHLDFLRRGVDVVSGLACCCHVSACDVRVATHGVAIPSGLGRPCPTETRAPRTGAFALLLLGADRRLDERLGLLGQGHVIGLLVTHGGLSLLGCRDSLALAAVRARTVLRCSEADALARDSVRVQTSRDARRQTRRQGLSVLPSDRCTGTLGLGERRLLRVLDPLLRSAQWSGCEPRHSDRKLGHRRRPIANSKARSSLSPPAKESSRPRVVHRRGDGVQCSLGPRWIARVCVPAAKRAVVKAKRTSGPTPTSSRHIARAPRSLRTTTL
jgi:hypothetical protein